MKKALLKDSMKEIKNTYKRFISILLMAFLGVGFFAGLRATSPDMVDTIDQYYKSQSVYDIQIMSTLGLTDNDIEEISKLKDIEIVEGTYETDGKLEIENKELIAKIMCIENLNQPKLINGKLAQNENECVVEESFLTFNNKKIGDYVEIEIENTTNEEGEEIQYLNQKKMQIVGTVKSPVYISRDRGTSKLGSGKIDYYIYIYKDNINEKSIYTNLYIKIKDSSEYITSSKKYDDYVEKIKQEIESIKEKREKQRHDELVEKATQKVNEAQNELDTQKQDAQQQIDEAQQELEKAEKEIKQAENTINSNQQKANTEFANALKQIQNANKEIQENEELLTNKEKEANAQFTQLETQKNDLQNQLTNLDNELIKLETQYNQIVEKLKDDKLSQTEKTILEQSENEIKIGITQLEQNKQELESAIIQIEQAINNGKQELENSKNQIQNAKLQLKQKENEYNETKKITYEQIESAKQTLANSKEQLQQGKKELDSKKQEFEEKTQEAQSKLTDAKEKINDIENPKWYVLDRYSNAGYNSFIQDTQSIENIATLFPIVFFVVATLISLTSMTRMVEEQRTQIGTLKALGYNKMQIASKYIIYASLACVIGSILGMTVGFIILPKVIWLMYEMMYDMTNISLSFNWKFGGIGLILISICIIGATIYTVMKELINTPATLMRPKSPKMGKRVLLERIPIIWKHLSFTKKVTVRNIFRYKKRFLMTIIGILGCTSLILAGFGLRDSIRSIMPNQFEQVFRYDMQINYKNELSGEQKQEYVNKLEQKDEISKIVETYMNSSTAIKGEEQEDVQIIVPENSQELDQLIHIKDINTNQDVDLKENEICITDKVAQLLGVRSGDTITIKNVEDEEIQIKISNIVENYVSHYIYMSKQTYEKIYNEEYNTNVLLIQNKEITQEQEDKLATEIMNQNEVASISRISTIMNMMDDTMKSLNYVVIILIISAGLLAFVVLYNLSNVNISERIRELATIKVLGFYDKEVYYYITRETVLLTAIGIGLGLIGGYFLNYFIIGTCEINMLRFSKIIFPMSYIYSILITIIFTIIVNIVTYFALKKIDMIESLKSVE